MIPPRDDASTLAGSEKMSHEDLVAEMVERAKAIRAFNRRGERLRELRPQQAPESLADSMGISGDEAGVSEDEAPGLVRAQDDDRAAVGGHPDTPAAGHADSADQDAATPVAVAAAATRPTVHTSATPAAGPITMRIVTASDFAYLNLLAKSARDGKELNPVIKPRPMRPLPPVWEVFPFRTLPQYSYDYEEMLPRPDLSMPNCGQEGAFVRISPPPIAPLPTISGAEEQPQPDVIITEAQLHDDYNSHPTDDTHKFIANPKVSKQAFEDILRAHPLLIRAWSMNILYRPRLKERFRTIYNTLAAVSNAEYDNARDMVIHFDKWTDRNKLHILNEIVASLNSQLYMTVNAQGACTGAWCRFNLKEVEWPRGNRELGLKRAIAWANRLGMDDV